MQTGLSVRQLERNPWPFDEHVFLRNLGESSPDLFALHTAGDHGCSRKSSRRRYARSDEPKRIDNPKGPWLELDMRPPSVLPRFVLILLPFCRYIHPECPIRKRYCKGHLPFSA